jgi:hypothetical protein
LLMDDSRLTRVRPLGDVETHDMEIAELGRFGHLDGLAIDHLLLHIDRDDVECVPRPGRSPPYDLPTDHPDWPPGGHAPPTREPTSVPLRPWSPAGHRHLTNTFAKPLPCSAPGRCPPDLIGEPDHTPRFSARGHLRDFRERTFGIDQPQCLR